MASATTGAAANDVGSNTGETDDLELLALETQFKALTAELDVLQQENDTRAIASCSDDQASVAESLLERPGHVATRQAEQILARLYPVELAIMAAPAHTIAGLGVKARHAAYVMSQYWTPPITELDWHAKVIRLLIESVCSLANVPLPFSDPDEPAESAREDPGSPSPSSR